MMGPISHYRSDPVVLCVGVWESSLVRACLEASCRWYGCSLVACGDPAAAQQAARELHAAGKSLVLIVVPASAAFSFNITLDSLAALCGAPLAILGVTAENAPSIRLELGSVRSAMIAHAGALVVAADKPAATGYELRGLRFEIGPGPHHRLELTTTRPTRTLATIGSVESAPEPIMVGVEAEQRLYLLAAMAGELPISSPNSTRRRVPLGQLVPLLLLVCDAGGPRCWRTPAAFANLTVDDPRLVEPYGCLSFPGLLAEMNRVPFHVSIGFIPWNYDRNDAAVVKLFRANPSRLSLAVHGNNHEGYEFFRYEAKPGDSQRSAPFEKQAFNIRQGLARIAEFERQTGLAVDRVMVFPQAISPAPTLEVLQQQGFWATANFSNVPLDAAVPEDPVAALRSALTDWYGLPALRRDYPHEYSEEAVAIDLFLGNPVLFMAHQDDFSEGIDAFSPHAERVNRRQPAVRWVSLGEITRQLHRVRWPDDSTCDVLMVSRHARLSNPKPNPVHFRVALPRATQVAGTRVTIDGKPHGWRYRDGEIQLELDLGPGATVLLEVHDPVPAAGESVPIARAGFRKRYLRLIADFRDLVVARSKLGRMVTKKYYRKLRRPALKIGRGRRRIALLWDASAAKLRTALFADLPS
jgi:hypothetical protein